MVTGQLTRTEASAALRRLEGLRDDWKRQVDRWKELAEKAENIKSLQREPSKPLVYTVEVANNQVGIATIRYNELERLIQDFRACALYLVHIPIPEGPDASFRSELPNLWSIPHAAPNTIAVALPGFSAGFVAEMAPMGSVQGLSSEIQMYEQYGGGMGGAGMGVGYGGYGDQMGRQMGGMMGGMMGQQAGIGMGYGGGSIPGQLTNMSGSTTGSSSAFLTQPPPHPGFSSPSPFQQQPVASGPSYGQTFNAPGGYSSQPLAPHHTSALYNQHQSWSVQNDPQQLVNQFAQNVYRPGEGFQPAQGGGGQDTQGVSPLNPFAPNAPHPAVVDANNRFPAVQ